MLCVLTPIVEYGLWVYAYNSGESQTERVQIFKSYLPQWQRGRFSVNYIGLLFYTIALILSSHAIKNINRLYLIINTTVIILSIVFFCLFLLSLM